MSSEFSFNERFLFNASACAAATFVTHPIELVKTRMQLQGELTTNYTKTYSKNIASARLVVKIDGFRGLYGGLSTGIAYQMLMNGTRLTLFDKLKENGVPILLASMVSGGFAGALSSPLYMLKTKRQALSKISVGCQHTDTRTPILNYFNNEYRIGGLRRVFHGMTGQILRVTAGGGAQLTSFETTKNYLSPYLIQFPWFANTACAAIVASFFCAVVVSPFDVVATRVFNQPLDPLTSRGVIYSGPVDALIKIWRAEGSSAYLKGLRAGYPRNALQTILTMSLWDIAKRYYERRKDTTLRRELRTRSIPHGEIANPARTRTQQTINI